MLRPQLLRLRPRVGRPESVILLAGLAVLAAAVRIVWCLTVLRHYHPVSDADDYLVLARSVSAGHGLAHVWPFTTAHPTAFRPPLWPLLLGAVFRVTEARVGVAQISNVVLGVLVVLLAATLAERLGGRRAAVVTGLLAAIYPPLLANDGTLLSEPLGLVLLLTLLHLLLSRRWAGAGVAAGLLLLTRPSGQLLVLGLALWLLLRVGRRSAAVFAAAAVLVVLPWVARNLIVLHEPTLVTSDDYNLASVYSPTSIAFGGYIDPALDHRFAAENRGATTERDLVERWRHQYREGLTHHPTWVPHLVVRNSLTVFDIRHVGNDGPEKLDGRSVWLRHRYLPFTWLVSALGIVGLWRLRRDSRATALLVTAVVITAASVATVGPPRLRAPLDVLFCVSIGVGAAERLSRGQHRVSPEASPDDRLSLQPARVAVLPP